jgi:hypothetical protein
MNWLITTLLSVRLISKLVLRFGYSIQVLLSGKTIHFRNGKYLVVSKTGISRHSSFNIAWNEVRHVDIFKKKPKIIYEYRTNTTRRRG